MTHAYDCQKTQRDSESTAKNAPVSRSSSTTEPLTRHPLWESLHGNEVPSALRLSAEPLQRKENTTGLPDTLKAGVETLSGLSLDDVQVHYNSSKPAGVQALAYTQGAEIHVGPGQEQHLAHEAWHVAQQKQGRVQATLQAKGMAINDDQGLEREADAMGARAQGMQNRNLPDTRLIQQAHLTSHSQPVVQRVLVLGTAQRTFLILQALLYKSVHDPNMPDDRVRELVNDVIQRENITTYAQALQTIQDFIDRAPDEADQPPPGRQH